MRWMHLARSKSLWSCVALTLALAACTHPGDDTPVSDENAVARDAAAGQGFIDVYLASPEGEPLQYAEIRVDRASDGELVSDDFGFYRGDPGRYGSEHIDPGTYRVVARVRGYGEAVSNSIQLRAGERQMVKFTLEQTEPPST